MAAALAFFWLLAFSASAAQSPAGKVDFNFQVRPILSDRCLRCHGPDEKARKGKLRLDTAAGAYAVRDPETGKRAIAPGHPEQSEMVRRLTTSDDDDRMPPAASHLTVSADETALLRRWIEQGAEYKTHWAFTPPGDVPVPQLPAGDKNGNPIDAFVRTRLAQEGLLPAPEASRETLIRRLSFDLRGLPPSLAEIDAFVADKAPDAYEKLVDALLASPAYGERQARDWLDLARYADTYGYQNDVERDMSPWRDWVIRAFNENLPYDQFILWQLAGDLLPNPTRDQRLATAFNRLHRQTNEGGSIDEEFRTEYVADRVLTTGTAFLGLTLGCARCHDHKYDPITQKDYYRMFAFFNQGDESGLYSHFTMATPSPTMLLFAAGVETRNHTLQEQIAKQEHALASLVTNPPPGFETWLAVGNRSLPRPVPAASFAFESVTNNSTPDQQQTNRSAQLVDDPELVPGRIGKALKFSGDNSVICTKAGAFDRTSAFSFSLWLRPAELQERAVIFHRSRSWSDSGSRGYELVLEHGRPTFGLIHFWPGNAIKVRSPVPLPTNEWSHLTITYDGSSRADGMHLYLNGERLALEIVRDNLFKGILHRKEWGDMEGSSVELTLAGRFRDSGFRNGAIDEFAVFDHCLTPWEARQLAGTASGPADRESLLAYYLREKDESARAAYHELAQLRDQENRLINDVPEIMVMRDMPTPRPTFVLKRGAYDAPGDPVEPDVPEQIFPFPKNLPRNRLGLAQWMLDPQNPLTSRVAVNRAWRTHFGRGLVLTEEDFGTQGKLPTHPELLDWLARDFMTHGWNLKALHKEIVMSATYRQSSTAAAELLTKDPENRMLARGPRHRLPAEEIRDEALAVSGLLASRIGGRSARPYQPEGLWEEAGTGKHYTPDHGEGLYRRSLYTFWRRTSPPPSMLVFDAPSREVCTARREITATPLQALVLLNDPQFVEAARALAERLVRDSGADLDARIERGFRLTTGRHPQPRETEILRQLYTEQLAIFQADPAAADKFLKTGEHPLDPSLPSQQVAATTVLTSTLINLDEFVTER